MQIDTGLVWLDAATALKYAALIQSEAVGAICRVPPFEPTANAALNFYGDLVLPLAQSTALEEYLGRHQRWSGVRPKCRRRVR